MLKIEAEKAFEITRGNFRFIIENEKWISVSEVIDYDIVWRQNLYR